MATKLWKRGQTHNIRFYTKHGVNVTVVTGLQRLTSTTSGKI